jgi:hypothetical protein
MLQFHRIKGSLSTLYLFIDFDFVADGLAEISVPA